MGVLAREMKRVHEREDSRSHEQLDAWLAIRQDEEEAIAEWCLRHGCHDGYNN